MSFPRGKKQPLAAPPAVATASKKRKLDAEEPDALFGKKGLASATSTSTSTSSTTSAKPTKVRKQPASGDVKSAKDKEPEALAAVLTYKALAKGLLVLGCVRQITESELLVSLPNKLNGVVALAEASDEFHAAATKKTKQQSDDELPALADIFRVGQFVPCVVLGKSKESSAKKISLSLRLSLLHAELSPESVAKGMALYGSVVSLEDHGAVVNLGVRGLTAFAPLRELEAAGLENVRKGQQLLFTVANVNAHTATATLSPDPAQALKAVTRGDSFTLQQLVPGMLLNVRVEDVLKNGLRVNFLTFFSATVEQNHMSNPCQQGWEDAYRKGLKGRARIVSVDRTSKVVTLSMAPHVVHLSVAEPAFVVGDVIENASIERIDAGIGMLLSLAAGKKKESAAEASDDAEPMETDGEDDNKKGANWLSFQPAYVHISNAADGHLDKLEKKFAVGNKVNCRVIGFAPFDAIVNVSCKESSLKQIVLRHKDLTPGLKVRAKILAIESWGVMLEISEGVRGVVAAQHVPPFVQLSKKKNIKKDAPTNSKFSVGKLVDARVLRVDLENKKTYLTMKKALLEADDSFILSSYEQAKQGFVAQGYITKIAEYGVVVSFYNNVYGLVPAALLHQAGIAKLDEAYVVGQIVKAAVTRCDIAKQRLMLTFDLTGTAVKAASAAKGSSATSESSANQELVGTIISNVKVLEVEAAAFRVQTEDGLEALLPFVQLTDFPRETALVDAIVKKYEVGDVIAERLVVLSVAKDGVLTLSKKPLLLQLASKSKHLPRTFDQVQERQLLVGFVASVSPTRGVFVRFLNNLTALAPKAFLSAKFVSEVEDGAFEIGETVVCSVEKVEKEKQQFVVGFREYATLKKGLSTPFLESYLKELAAMTENDAPYALGKTEKAEFLGLRPYGAVFTLANEEDEDAPFTVIVPGVEEKTAKKWDEGDKLKVLLVDYDFEKNVYYGSVDKALVESGSKKARKQKTRVSKSTSVSDARVVSVRENYAVVAFADTQNSELQQLGLLQVADFWCPSRTSASAELELGSAVSSSFIASPALGSLAEDKKTPFDGLPLLVYEDAELLSAPTKKSKSKTPKDENAEHLPKYTSEDLALGKLVTGRIVGIKENSLELKLKASSKCGKVVATVSVVDVDEGEEDHPFDRFNVNMVVQGRVLAVVEKGANQRKPVSESNPANFRALSVSLRAKDIATDDVQKLVRADWQEGSAGRALLKAGSAVEGVVVEQETEGLLVRLSHRVVAFASAVELSKDLATLKNFRQQFPVGKRVQGWIVGVDEEKKHLELSLVRASAEPAALKAGGVVNGMVTTKVATLKAPAVMVQLGVHTFGRADVTELLPPTQWKNEMHKLPQFAHGQFVRCVVLSSEGGHVDLSLREDALADAKGYAKQKLPEHAVGSLVTAIVASTTTSGCFLRVDRQTLARAMLRDLSDEFVKDPIKEFPAGKLVVGRVTKATDKGLELSLKASVVSEDVAMVKWSDLREGLTVKGTITKVQTYGVFVKIEKSNISGLCHISEIADERVTQALDQIFSPGDYVKAKILKIEDRRVSFGLKPSYFEGEPESSDEEEEDDEEEEEEEEAEAMEVDGEEEEEDDDEEDEEEEDDEEESVKKPSKKKMVTSAMEVDEEEAIPSSDSEDDEEKDAAKSVAFTWDGFANVLDQHKSKADDSDSDSEEDDTKKTQQLKHKQKKQTDEWIALREKALASQDERPQTADDFERLLAVNPQSSFLWIQYMAFHVSLTQVDVARDVAVRATSAVSFRDEKEKLNVWVAYLNLEHDFGDEASFKRVFNSALRVNHPKRVYLQLVDIYARANELRDAEATLATLQKKFRKSKQGWLRALTLHVAQQQDTGKAAETLQRALQALAPHKHLPVILKYGQLMFEHGELDKARTIFEGVLANYPKRLDLWNVYLDKEIKCNGGELDVVRALFERLLAMDFTAKKMKFLFKKFLAFEQTHGDAASVERVKQLAKDFVATAASA